MSSLKERLEAVMAAPLATLVAPDHQERPPLSAVQLWNLPESDLDALTLWGLPTDMLMSPKVQLEVEPLLMPKVASEREGRLISPEQRLYDLGRWGSDDLTPKLGAIAGDGRVMAISDAPTTDAKLRGFLKEYYRGIYIPSVQFISSSVAQFIEVAWRWRAASAILRELSLQEPDCTRRPIEEFDAYVARRTACERLIISGIEAIDPAVNADAPDSLWGKVIHLRGY
ncbi:hypothetical protein GA0070624_0884 [Micromonospora rhizosphaerae]|uniref:SUKH-4 immunity protein n=1 Tax=Micromonospora rhizosphaerae TaxID=568872 RepID=A0A1C6RFX5_9ACTN|nr:SUKH-4 family immunity protein [Micromonospora rhizosphaerae]SCL15981.1 hypothetical protein GA0070624_0884 [Micromonospora rhizosphaerae]